MDNICKKTLNAVGQTLLKVIYKRINLFLKKLLINFV